MKEYIQELEQRIEKLETQNEEIDKNSELYKKCFKLLINVITSTRPDVELEQILRTLEQYERICVPSSKESYREIITRFKDNF